MNDDSVKYRIERPVYSYDELTQDYNETKSKSSILKSLRSKAEASNHSLKSIVESVIPFPFIIASFYSWRFLLLDLIAGFTMLILHIPQGMAYGVLAGLKPINGLYASFIPPLTYFLFGTSRHLSIGTFSIMALLASGSALREATLDMKTLHNVTQNGTLLGLEEAHAMFEMEKLNITIATTLLAGIFQLIMGFCKFGFLMHYISDSLIEGFTTAVAFHVLLSQLGTVLGYSIHRYSGMGELPYKLYLYATSITDTHWVTLEISVLCIIMLLLVSELVNPIFQKRFKFPLPTQFVFVIIGTVMSYYGNISKNYSVKIIGPIPKGIPEVMIPDISIMPRIVSDAFILAAVGFIMNSALVKVYALKFSYKVNFNQELVAYGLSNMLGSFFQCTISSGALARSAVAVNAGMKSQFASIFSCIFMLFVLLFIGPLFQYVPTCVLSAIIIVSLKGMIMQFKNLPKLYRISKYDFNVWVVTFLATIFLNVTLGFATGFLFSLLTIIIRIQNPKIEVLGQLPTTNIYKDVKCFEKAKEIYNVKIFRFEAPLHFANAEFFKSKLYQKTNLKHLLAEDNTEDVKDTPIPFEGSYQNGIGMPDNMESHGITLNMEIEDVNDKLEFIIIDFSSINYVDKDAIRVLNDIYSDTKKKGIWMLIAGPNTKTREMLEVSRFADANLDQIMFPTVHDAVLRTLQK